MCARGPRPLPPLADLHRADCNENSLAPTQELAEIKKRKNHNLDTASFFLKCYSNPDFPITRSIIAPRAFPTEDLCADKRGVEVTVLFDFRSTARQPLLRSLLEAKPALSTTARDLFWSHRETAGSKLHDSPRAGFNGPSRSPTAWFVTCHYLFLFFGPKSKSTLTTIAAWSFHAICLKTAVHEVIMLCPDYCFKPV